MYLDRYTAIVLGLLVFVAPTFGVTLNDLCQSTSDDMVIELCDAQAALETAQNHLQNLAEKLVLTGDIQKRKNEFVRFGRSDGEEGQQLGDDLHAATKRKNEFVRFGKRKNEFVRFGKKSETVNVEQTPTAEKRKNEFVRFG